MKVKKAVFPVAGFGTRMLPATKAIPKEMITLIDKPLIHYAVEEAVNSGIEQMIFITGRTKRSLEDYFDINVELNVTLENSGKYDLLEDMRRISEMVDVTYVRQKKMLGLGNAILCVKDIVRGEPFAVILPDDIILAEKPVTAQLIEQFQKVKKPVVSLMNIKTEDAHKYGIVEVKETVDDRFYRLGNMVEKPKENPPSDLAIIGRYIITPDVMDVLENTAPGSGGEIQLTDALKHVAKYNDVYGYGFEGKRFDCGTKLGLLEATVNYAAANPELRQGLKDSIKGLNL
ncbi:MAG: UTP--glucose-1-phosphate uridylyltransferase GalU [Deferribacterales bacterium]|nr:UTP--glucose-1-phosphate uridylyltransferase GalU [Deferribacterales bacterium]